MRSLVIDSQTRIVYLGLVIDEELVAKEHYHFIYNSERHHAEMSSRLPLEELVLCDILDAPLTIVRNPAHGDLVFQTKITPRQDERKEFGRPYTEISLVPTGGEVRAVRYRPNPNGDVNFELLASEPTHVIYHKIKNHDLRMIIEFTKSSHSPNP